mmetsp:Transcript_13599/g.34394  ORF Transcript_13599/g.34394 Transcript_13599/m.34394 type:complete len:231 (-) Transcript_13599:2506-3198(-)
MKKRKSSLYGTSSVPNLSSHCPPFLKICFIKTGSSDGSNTSSTFSKRIGLPSRIPVSRVRKKFGVLNLMTPRPLSFFICFIHLFPWPWGSTINGHRRPRVTRIPFSTDRSSEGKDLIAHSRISAGSQSTSAHFQFGSAASFTSFAFASQVLTSMARKSAVKAPAYAMNPAARVMFPTTNCKFFSNSLLFLSQLFASLPRPPNNFSARTSLTLQVSASCSNFSALLFARIS